MFIFFYLSSSSSFIRRIERHDSTGGRKLSLPHIEEPAYRRNKQRGQRRKNRKWPRYKPRLRRFLPSLLFAAQHVSLSSPLLSPFLLTRIRTIHCAPSFGSPEGRRGVGWPPGGPPLPRIIASLQLCHLLVISFARCVRCQGDLCHSYRRLHRGRERALKRHALAGQLASRVWNLLNFTLIQIDLPYNRINGIKYVKNLSNPRGVLQIYFHMYFLFIRNAVTKRKTLQMWIG